MSAAVEVASAAHGQKPCSEHRLAIVPDRSVAGSSIIDSLADMFSPREMAELDLVHTHHHFEVFKRSKFAQFASKQHQTVMWFTSPCIPFSHCSPEKCCLHAGTHDIWVASLVSFPVTECFPDILGYSSVKQMLVITYSCGQMKSQMLGSLFPTNCPSPK